MRSRYKPGVRQPITWQQKRQQQVRLLERRQMRQQLGLEQP